MRSSVSTHAQKAMKAQKMSENQPFLHTHIFVGLYFVQFSQS